MYSTKSRLYVLLSNFNQLKWSLAFKSIVCGFLVGGLVSLYRFGIKEGTSIAVAIYAHIKTQPLLLLPWTGAAIAIGLLIAWLIRWEPMASGSGIPQVEGQVLQGLRMKWAPILVVRYVGGLLSSLFGISVGREGPSIQIGAVGSLAFSNVIKRSKLEENYLITGGAGAGLSAAFGAPLSGMMFALEEVHRSFSPSILLSAVSASLSADFVASYCFGLHPILDFTHILTLPEQYYIWLLPLGLLAGIVGASVNKALLGFQTLYSYIPAWLRPMIAFAIALPVGLFAPQLLGGGDEIIGFTETTRSSIGLLLCFGVIKLLFTATSYGSGVPGGIFMPILATGSLFGAALGAASVQTGMPHTYIPTFVVCAMSGAMAASVKAPVTAILLTVEMSGTISHMLPVTLCTFIALLVSDILKIQPIYEALLDRYLQKHPIARTSKSHPLTMSRGVMEFPVELGSAICNETMGAIHWPEGSLVVNIRRGEENLMPTHDITLLPGDYLVVMFSSVHEAEIRKSLLDLSSAHDAEQSKYEVRKTEKERMAQHQQQS